MGRNRKRNKKAGAAKPAPEPSAGQPDEASASTAERLTDTDGSGGRTDGSGQAAIAVTERGATGATGEGGDASDPGEGGDASDPGAAGGPGPATISSLAADEPRIVHEVGSSGAATKIDQAPSPEEEEPERRGGSSKSSRRVEDGAEEAGAGAASDADVDVDVDGRDRSSPARSIGSIDAVAEAGSRRVSFEAAPTLHRPARRSEGDVGMGFATAIGRRNTVGEVEDLGAIAAITPPSVSPAAASKPLDALRVPTSPMRAGLAGAASMTPGFFRRMVSMDPARDGGARMLRRAKSLGAAGIAATTGDSVGPGVEQEHVRTARKKARKMRKRLKRLVHATNTMGAAVSAKEQTTTQLALCMQLGLTLGLRHQRPASSIAETDDASGALDPPLVLNVGSKEVEDGSHLPAFRFIVHAPCRFERVRAAWNLDLKTYMASFQLDPKLVAAVANDELSGSGVENAAAPPSDAVRPSVESSEDGEGGVRQTDVAAAAVDTSAEGGEKAEAPPSPTGDVSLSDVELELSGPGSGPGSGCDSDGKHGTRRKLLPSTTSLRVISTSAASGKSSSWFFCSNDSRFLVKTCTKDERDVLKNILGEYCKHAAENSSTSMLPQYYGLYTIEVGRRSAHFIIMNYWFATMHPIAVRYDLKGSTRGRSASARERRKGTAAVLKDLDIMEAGTKVENKLATVVKQAIEKDVEFLEKNQLIDYSMMLGLHYKDSGTLHAAGVGEVSGGEKSGGEGGEVGSQAGRNRRRDSGFGSMDEDQSVHLGLPSPAHERPGLAAESLGEVVLSLPPSPAEDAAAVASMAKYKTAQASVRDGPFCGFTAEGNRIFQLRALETPFGLAYLGIIDILTKYTAVKTVENMCFGRLMCGADISCQPPDVYADRFKRFINRVLVEPETTGPNCGEGEESEEGNPSATAEDAASRDEGRPRSAARSLEVEMAAVAK